jgi:hypothetical protein
VLKGERRVILPPRRVAVVDLVFAEIPYDKAGSTKAV